MANEVRYAIGELAQLAGVSRRTVRYYVQEGLIPAPLGVGRGDHYGPQHLEQILRVKSLQEAGRTLDQIRSGPIPREPGSPDKSTLPTHAERSLWRRLAIAPGVELHLAANVRIPSPRRLDELADWCRLHMAPAALDEDEDHHE